MEEKEKEQKKQGWERTREKKMERVKEGIGGRNEG
jgi:hypothetical protein